MAIFLTTEHCISRVLWDRTLHVIVERLYNRVAGENSLYLFTAKFYCD